MLECDCDCCDVSLRVASYKDLSHRIMQDLPFVIAQHCFHPVGVYMCMREVSKICTYMYMLLATMETLVLVL